MFPNFSVGSSFGLPLPYRTPIVPSLSSGTQIHVIGTPTGSRFEINVKNSQDDILIHVNPRLDDRVLVLNSAQRGSWAQEQRHSIALQRGMRCTFVITVTDSGFRISLNNLHIGEFHHRLPMQMGQLVEIKGDLTLESAQVVPSQMGFGGFPQMGGPQMSFNPFPQGNFSAGGMNVSFGGPPMSGFAPPPPVMAGHVPSIQSCQIHTGSRIFVRGQIHPNAKRFELNFLQGHTDSSDVAFHFNPRFDSRTIVKNHRSHGQWGNEENQPFPPHMPLMPGAMIDLQIVCDPMRYIVYMNNQLIAEFYHKIPPGFVMAVQYKGDITVHGIGQM